MNIIHLFKIRSALLFTAALLILAPFCCNEALAISASHISAIAAYDGTYKKETGLPMKIVIEEHEGKHIEGEIEITGGLIKYSAAVNLEPYSIYEKWIITYPSGTSNLMMQFTTKDGFSFNKEIQTSQFISKKMLTLHITKEKGRMPYSTSGLNNEEVFIEVTPGELWDIWKGYEAADHVLLDADAVEAMTVNQLRALKRYLHFGGSLYIGGSIYPEIYGQDFFLDILSININGIKTLAQDSLYPGSPYAEVLSLEATNRRALFKRTDGFTISAEERKGIGRVSILSFDPADKAFQPFLSLIGGLWQSYDWQKRALLIPADTSNEKRGRLFISIVKWETGYLISLALIGFLWKKRYGRFLWPVLFILVAAASLASLGMMNSKNRLYGTSVINISPDEEDAFIQSKLRITPVRYKELNAEFQEGYIYPVTTNAAADKIKISDTGHSNIITAGLMMMEQKDFIWERFKKIERFLEADLEVYKDEVNGEIKNISAYSLIDPYIYMNGRFFLLPSIEAGDKISVNIKYEETDYLPYPEGRQWISKYIQANEEGGASQGIKIVGLYEMPLLKATESGLFVEKEDVFLLYHM